MHRLLYVHNSADLYGASRSLIRLISTLDRGRFEPLALLPAEGDLAGRLRELGVRVLVDSSLSVIDRARFKSWRLLWLFLTFPWSIQKLLILLRWERIDLVHTNTGVILSPGPAAWLAGIPHVWHIRDWFQEFSAFWKWYERWMRLCSSRIIAVSEAIAGQFTDREKVRVVHNGFDLDEFPLDPAARAAFRQQYGLRDEPVVGCVGRIKLQRKGQEVLLKAAALLKARGIRAQYLIVGAPFPGNESHLESLQELVRDGGLEGDVIFTGEIPDPRPAYAAMDIFVLPSAQPEPFGGVVMEAMAMKLPVIATAIGGSVEQVADGESGFFVPPNDPVALAGKLEVLLGDAALRERFGAAGRERIATKFALPEKVREIEAIYEDCLRTSDFHV